MAAEEQIGKLAQELMKNPVVTGAASAAFGARERAAQAQEAVMAAFNLPSAGDIERLTRRLRSVSQRIEGLEDGIDRIVEKLDSVDSSALLDKRLTAIEDRLAVIEQTLRGAS